MVRTTVSLDDDLATSLRSEARESGRSFHEVVNDKIRWGIANQPAADSAKPFRVKARDLGSLRPGLSLADTSELLDHVEGPFHL